MRLKQAVYVIFIELLKEMKKPILNFRSVMPTLVSNLSVVGRRKASNIGIYAVDEIFSKISMG